MLSFRQLEAFMWAVRLRTLSRAAIRLNLAQPTMSKRIQELEAECGFEVFKKAGRSVELTPRGDRLYKMAEQVFLLLDQVAEIRSLEESPRRKVSVGVTELTAYTWLPTLVRVLTEQFPLVDPHVAVDHGVHLRNKLQSGELDIIVCPAFPLDQGLFVLPLQELEFSLVGSPRLCGADHFYDGAALSRLPFLTHGAQSGAVSTLRNWMRDIGASPEHIIEVDSVAAQVGMAIGSMGVTLLPRKMFGHLIESGQLLELTATLPVPTVEYRIAYRRHERGSLIEQIASCIPSVCDFTINNQD
jgi:DNA-binding transcriptional LysR family regulator